MSRTHRLSSNERLSLSDSLSPFLPRDTIYTSLPAQISPCAIHKTNNLEIVEKPSKHPSPPHHSHQLSPLRRHHHLATRRRTSSALFLLSASYNTHNKHQTRASDTLRSPLDTTPRTNPTSSVNKYLSSTLAQRWTVGRIRHVTAGRSSRSGRMDHWYK